MSTFLFIRVTLSVKMQQSRVWGLQFRLSIHRANVLFSALTQVILLAFMTQRDYPIVLIALYMPHVNV